MNIISRLFASLNAGKRQQSSSHGAYVASMIDLATRSDACEVLHEMSGHGSGYVREAVIKRCVELARADLFLLLIDRLNDWVPEVRSLARQGVLTVLPLMPVSTLLAALTGMLTQSARSRDRYVDWQQQFEAALIEHVPVDDFAHAVASADIKTARSAAYALHKYATVEPARLLALCATRNDDIVLTDRALELVALLPTEQRIAHYRTALRSTFGPVRAKSLQALLACSEDMPALEATAVAALTDPQSSVRSIAARFLTPRGFDLRAHYRHRLSDAGTAAAQTRICLIALASLRNADDLAFVKSFLQHDGVLIRLAALSAWLRIAEKDKDAVADAAIRDGAPRIVKLALELVRKRGAYIPLALVQQQLLTKRHVSLFLGFTCYNKWDHLESITRLSLTCGEIEAQELGLDAHLSAWCRRGRHGWFERTSPAQFAFLASGDAVQSLQRLMPAGQDINAYLRQDLIR